MKTKSNDLEKQLSKEWNSSRDDESSVVSFINSHLACSSYFQYKILTFELIFILKTLYTKFHQC